MTWEDFGARPAPDCTLPQAQPHDICYLQYSSGSTRFPHGVAVTHNALLNNLSAHSHGMELTANDRCVSWLPWYHDMGLVGCFLSPVANQVSTDYMKTEDFARRPLAWLDVISAADGTVISTTNSFDYRGEPIKYVEHHNTQKQLTRYFIYRGKDDLLTYQVKNTYIGNKLATQYIWNSDKKGKALSSFNYSYNAQGSLLSQRDSFFNGSKVKTNTYKFTYNDNDLLSSKSGYDQDGKLFSLVNYRYKYFVKKD